MGYGAFMSGHEITISGQIDKCQTDRNILPSTMFTLGMYVSLLLAFTSIENTLQSVSL